MSIHSLSIYLNILTKIVTIYLMVLINLQSLPSQLTTCYRLFWQMSTSIINTSSCTAAHKTDSTHKQDQILFYLIQFVRLDVYVQNVVPSSMEYLFLFCQFSFVTHYTRLLSLFIADILISVVRLFLAIILKCSSLV